MIAPNAGIDKSNVPKGHAILYPRDPFETAEKLRLKFLAHLGIRVGIVIADSRPYADSYWHNWSRNRLCWL